MFFLMLLAVPVFDAMILIANRKRRIDMLLLTTAITLLLGVIGLKSAFAGTTITFRLSSAGSGAPTFQADSLSAVFVLLAAFVWFADSIYAHKYYEHEGGEKRFDFWTLLTLTAVLGVFIAGDLFTLLIFFALMAVTSFFWVIHNRNDETVKAGKFYLVYSIISWLLLIIGTILLRLATGFFPVIGSGAVEPLDSRLFAWSIAFLVAGFGIKAGIVPLHTWLHYTHSAAPAPSSALISGLILKVGIYGLIRAAQFAGWDKGLGNGTEWLGLTLAVLGMCTILVGTFAAIFQSHAKRLLAYSSVSQIGYIVLGLGLSLWLGHEGGIGLLGALYHVVNHALLKVALALGYGVIYMNTHQTNLYKMGGNWRRFPATAVFMLIAVLGIVGMPGLNGYASKTIIHHAVSHAAETGAVWAVWIERLFLIAGVGTATYFSKLYYLIFLAKPAGEGKHGKETPSMLVAMGILSAAMLLIGIVPKLFPGLIGMKAVQALGVGDPHEILAELGFWGSGDIIGMVITMALGVLICWVGLKTGFLRREPPAWLSLEGIFANIGRGVTRVCRRAAGLFGTADKSSE